MSLVAVFFGGAACLVGHAVTRGPPPSAPQAHLESLPNFLGSRRGQYAASLTQARGWLDGLRVDPVELRAKGRKGKKHFVELLDTYSRLHAVAADHERSEVLEHIRQIALPAYDARYHDMLTNDDATFKQDATSYLRAALVMDRLGLDITYYRREIAKIHARLDAHMKARGVNQRMVFAWYYQHFGLREPFPLVSAFGRGIIRSRMDPASIDLADTYSLTHEVFGPYEYGDNLAADPFSLEDKLYLRHALPALSRRFRAHANADIVAELVSCMRFLRFVDLNEYRAAIKFVLASQNRNGSWGRYERLRPKLGDMLEVARTLHTTAVAVDALTVVFHEPWNKQVVPWTHAVGQGSGR